MYNKNDIILNKYKVSKVLDKGGMSDFVGVCENLELGQEDTYSNNKSRWVVVKVIKKESSKERPVERTREELITAIRVKNKNLVNTHSIDQDDKYFYIVMEYIDGSTLTNKIKQQESINYKEAYFLFKQLVESVRALHSYNNKIIHLDLKPDNVFLSADGSSIKVADFGISTILGKNNVVLSSESKFKGTPGYVSPDIMFTDKVKEKNRYKEDFPVNYKREINEQFDIYALGIIFYEMLTGDIPFFAPKSENIQNENIYIIKASLNHYPAKLSQYNHNIPNSFYNIIFRCLVSKTEDLKYRYKNCDEILQDLDTALNNDRIEEPLIVDTKINPKFFNTNIFALRLSNSISSKTFRLAQKKSVIISIISLSLISLVVVLVAFIMRLK